jgi:hypothetical protein
MTELRLTVFEHGHSEASGSEIQYVEVLAGQACTDFMVNGG